MTRRTGFEPTRSPMWRYVWLILAGLVACGVVQLVADLARMVQP